MKVKVRTDGSCDGKSYKRGDVLDHDSEGVRRLLINGVATPEDEHAAQVLANESFQEQYSSQALKNLASELNARDAKEAEAPAPSEGGN